MDDDSVPSKFPLVNSSLEEIARSDHVVAIVKKPFFSRPTFIATHDCEGYRLVGPSAGVELRLEKDAVKNSSWMYKVDFLACKQLPLVLGGGKIYEFSLNDHLYRFHTSSKTLAQMLNGHLRDQVSFDAYRDRRRQLLHGTLPSTPSQIILPSAPLSPSQWSRKNEYNHLPKDASIHYQRPGLFTR